VHSKSQAKELSGNIKFRKTHATPGLVNTLQWEEGFNEEDV